MHFMGEKLRIPNTKHDLVTPNTGRHIAGDIEVSMNNEPDAMSVSVNRLRMARTCARAPELGHLPSTSSTAI